MRRGFILVATALFFITTAAFGQTADEVNRRKAALEIELQTVEKQIAEQTKLLQTTQQEKASLQRDLNILSAQISRAKLIIKQHQIEIEQLGGDIEKKTGTITQLTGKIEASRASLAELLRKRRDAEEVTVVELLLEPDSLANLTNTVAAYQYLEDAIHQAFATIRSTKAETEGAKVALEDRQQAEIDTRQAIEAEKRLIEKKEGDKKQLLTITKNQEVNYKNLLAERQKHAAQIRAALFALRDTAAIPFGEALAYATKASQKTSVRPALILAILTQESNLGENQGSCILSSLQTGDGVGKNTGTPFEKVMKAPRDTVPFLDITKRLGLDPDKMPVSKKPWYGYGGAMGPAQFIPSTWILYEERIAAATSHNPPNPWDPGDAFMAAALLLDDNGAGKGTYAAERLAALRYLAGWANAGKKAYAFYGDDVMELAEKYQKQIDILQAS